MMHVDSYLHDLKDFRELIQVVASERRILPQLIEKDYWIMHALHGLAKQGFVFELKGGTSLSKGYRIIERFSEDIDLRINDIKFALTLTDGTKAEGGLAFDITERKQAEEALRLFPCAGFFFSSRSTFLEAKKNCRGKSTEVTV